MAEITELAVLLERCRAGEQSAWRALFEAHFDFVHRTARRLGTPDDEVDDVCQETFVVAFRKLDQFESGRFTTWLYRICANVSSDRHRRRRTRDAFAQILPRRVPPPESRGPDREFERKQASEQVSDVLARMKPKKREVFALYELEGLSGKEIAELVGCPIETVWVRLHNARKDFARIAKKRGVVA